MISSIENSWVYEGGLWQDPDLAKVRGSLLRYRPRPFTPDLCAQPILGILRGPRRVGKTVTLKLLVAELIEETGWDGRDILT